MLESIIQSLPPGPGSYLLWLYLPQSQDLSIGKLGTFKFPAGEYIYLGSAHGPGGLRARLGRNLRGSGAVHWHIDGLRAGKVEDTNNWVVPVRIPEGVEV